MSHPFVEQLISSIRREVLDHRGHAMERIDLSGQLAHKDVMVYYLSATALCDFGEEELALDTVPVTLSLGYPAHRVNADADPSCLK